MKPLKADLLMFIITACWGSSYLFMKMGLGSLGEFNLIALRFGLAFLVAGALFFKHILKVDLKTIRYGALLGFLLFTLFALLESGLKTTTASNAGFLFSLTVIFVPLISLLIYRKKMGLKLMLSVCLAVIGIGLLTLQGPVGIKPGDMLCVLAAVFFAIHIIVVNKAAKSINTLKLGIWQLGFAGLFGLIASIIFETPTLPSTSHGWLAVLALSLVCSAFGFIAQAIAQKYTTATRTGLIFSMEPIFAALFGFWFANEVMTAKGYVGAALVLIGIVISEVHMNPVQVVQLGFGKVRNVVFGETIEK